ncbi:MAG: GH3 auxin-responsive promoter family protein, partial [Muribaculaceae bacterium]|nr:GH3 auxin-responsive promoter family protein [Muribaculaceae bacterium]
RYPIGDTVRIESINPVKITITGRTKHFINAFGEELMVHNADAAIAKACAEMGCDVANYTAAPVFAGDHSRGRHEWLIEFNRRPADIETFADRLDTLLQQENSDYQAKRFKGIFLDRLTIVEAPAGLFDRWLASTGKLGGQRKVPRLCNSRKFIDPMLSLIDNNK